MLVGADSAVQVAMKTLLPTRDMDALWTRSLGLHQQPPPTVPVIREEPTARGSGDAIRRVEVGPAATTPVPRPPDGRPAELRDRPAVS